MQEGQVCALVFKTLAVVTAVSITSQFKGVRVCLGSVGICPVEPVEPLHVDDQ